MTAGCSSMLSGLDAKTEFHCSAPVGIPCQSITATNHQLNTGGMAQTQAKEDEEKRPVATVPVYVETPAKISPKGLATPNTGVPLRSPERILRVWVAPFEDRDGTLYDQRYMYVMVEAGRWMIEANRVALRERFQVIRPLQSQQREQAPSIQRSEGGSLISPAAQTQQRQQMPQGPQPEPPQIQEQ
jgi:conjugal transfer pilus assembly protein TraV